MFYFTRTCKRNNNNNNNNKLFFILIFIKEISDSIPTQFDTIAEVKFAIAGGM